MMSGGNLVKKINDLFLPTPKIIYFTIMWSHYSFYLFRGKFITRYLRLSDQQYGDISGFMAITAFLSMNLWSSLADKFSRHRLILAVLCLMLGLIFQLLIPVSKIANQDTRFYLSILVCCLYNGFWAGLPPLTDYLTLKLLSSGPVEFSKDLYGRQVVWGTISYGITCYLVGYLIKSSGYETLFYIVPISSAFSILTIFIFAPADVSRDEGERLKKSEAPNNTPRPKRPVITLLSNYKFLFTLVVVFLIGCSRAVMTTFLSKYWADIIKLDPDQVGIAANFGILMEIIIFLAGPFCLKKFGIYWMLIMAQVAMAIRTWGYVFLPPGGNSFYYVCLIELLKGVGYGFTQLSGVKIASETAPAGLEATAQAIYSSIFSPLPTITTAFAGGRIWSYFDPSKLFLIAAIISTIGLILCTLKSLVDGNISFFGFRFGGRDDR